MDPAHNADPVTRLLMHHLCCCQVVSVDCNPAQSALLELKTVAIQQLDFEDAWQMFGEGVHPRIDEVYEQKLAPFLSQTSHNFWSKRLWYFKSGTHGCVVRGEGDALGAVRVCVCRQQGVLQVLV